MKSVQKNLLIFLTLLILLGAGGLLVWNNAGIPKILGSEEVTFQKEISFNAPLRFEFSEKMNTKSVEEAFSITPEIKGKFLWENQRTLFFVPTDPFTIGDKVTVTISSEAMSWLGKKTGVSYSQDFLIVGSPQISFISPISSDEWTVVKSIQDGGDPLTTKPAKGYEETIPYLLKGQRIVIMFDRPIRPLESTEAAIDEELSRFSDYIEFTPEIPGEFRWLGTSSIEFIPDTEKLPMGNIFRATLQKDAPLADGGKLVNDFEWHFQTDEPRIVSVSPIDGSTYISPSTRVKIKWNQPVDEDSFFEKLTIEPDLPEGEGRKIDVSWDRENDPTTMIISFEPNFPKDTEIKITVAPGVKSITGTKFSTETFLSTFRTLGEPKIIAHYPAEKAVFPPQGSLSISFSTPFDGEEIRTHLKFTPEIKGEDIIISEVYDSYYWADDPLATPNEPVSMSVEYSISAPFAAQTEYTWELTPGLVDRRVQMYEDNLKEGMTDELSEGELTILKSEATLNEGFKDTFKTGDYDPYLTQLTTGYGLGIHDVESPVSLYVEHRNVSEVDVIVCEMSEEKLRDFDITGGYYYGTTLCDEFGGKKTTWKEKLPGASNMMLVTEIPLSERLDLKKGSYLYEFSSPSYKYSWETEPHIFSGGMILVNSTLTAKWADGESLFWATDFVSGRPVEDMEIVVYRGSYDVPVVEAGRGKTDAQGLVKISLPEEADFYGRYFAIGKKGDEYLSYVGEYWDSGITTWDFGVSQDWQSHPYYRGYLYTDRPIYRPDQTVYFKGIIRKDDDATLSIPDPQTLLNVEITSPEGDSVFKADMPISEDGTFSGELKLSPEAKLGVYMLSASLGDMNWFSRPFFVEEYRKPDFKVEVLSGAEETPDAGPETQFIGKDLPVTISGSYYFGGVLSSGEVNYTVVREPYYFFDWDGEGWYSFSTDEYFCWWDCSASETVVASGSGRLDDAGKFTLKIPGDLKSIENTEDEGPLPSQLVTVYATVSDLTERSVAKAETFIFYQADGLVGISPDEYFLPETSDSASFSLITIDTKGKPRGDEKVTVDLYQSKWNSVQKEGVDGNYYWESTEEKVLLDSTEVTTDTDGKGKAKFSIPAGDSKYYGNLKAVAQWKDSEGRETSSSTSIYRASESFVSWRRENNDRIALTLDAKEYKIGETARLLVASPYTTPVRALLTIERAKILKTEVIDVSSGKYIEIPVTADFVPNTFISVVLIHGKGSSGMVQNLKTSLEENKKKQGDLETEITTLKEKLTKAEEEANALAEDADKVERRRVETRLEVAKTNLSNAENELSALKVESSTLETEIAGAEKESGSTAEGDPGSAVEGTIPRPEMKMGLVPLFVNIDDKKLNITLTPNKENYLPGETVILKVETKNSKGDGVPADVSLAVVDESLLALKSRNLENIVEFFWGPRSLGVMTSNTLVYFVERLNVKAQKGEKGGGGGAAGDLAKKKRGEFRDTAYYLPDLKTDINGEGEVEFILPDNLTSWEIWAVANTKKSEVGAQTKSFISRKELMIQSSLPRFAVVGDEFTASFLIHNQSDEDQKIDVTLTAKNFDIEGEGRESLTIEKDSQLLVEFPGTVIGSGEKPLAEFDPMTFTLVAETKGSGLKDELEIDVPVLTPAIGESIATSGEVQDDLATEYLRIPEVALNDIGKLTVSLSASRTGTFTRGLESLLQYPYGCAEQTMSTHFPNVILKRVESTLGKKLFDLDRDESEIKEMVEMALQKFYTFQRPDGGFGYWEDSDKSYPYLSAYILFGLQETERAGYDVDDTVISNAKSYLKGELFSSTPPSQATSELDYYGYPEMDADAQAFALFVLSEFGEEGLISSKNILFENRSALSFSAKTFLLMAMQNMKDDPQGKDVLLGEILADARQTPRGVQFESGESSPWAMDSSSKTTALVLYALTREDTAHPLIPKILDYLAKSKDQGRYLGSWGDTQTTSWVLIAYLEYLEKSDALHPDFTGSAELNGSSLGEAKFGDANVFEEVALSETHVSSLLRGTQLNEIDFSKKGTGILYYDILMNYYLPVEFVTEKNEGIGISRSYYRKDDKKTETPVSTAEKGEVLRGKLTIMVPETRHLVVVSEKLPAGLEPVNFSLETSDRSLLVDEEGGQSWDYEYSWWWWDSLWYFNHREMRDDEVLLFADYLPAGMYEYHFFVTASTEGEFLHLPATAEEMYNPEVFGRTNGEKFTVSK